MRGETSYAPRKWPPPYFNPLPSCEGRLLTHSTISQYTSHFNPLPSCEGRPNHPCSTSQHAQFQSTPLMRGETPTDPILHQYPVISIHSPHARGDCSGSGGVCGIHRFQSTPLMRGETSSPAPEPMWLEFQSTPLMRGETEAHILALTVSLISIHSPHARGDAWTRPKLSLSATFQSTPLMRGETGKRHRRQCAHTDFNPLPSCEGRPCAPTSGSAS